MGGSRWCKNCHTSHEGPTGSKCQKFDSQAQEDGDQASLETQASSIALTNETVVSEEHARLVAQQVDVHSVINRQETSTGDKGIDAGQQYIYNITRNTKIGKAFWSVGRAGSQRQGGIDRSSESGETTNARTMPKEGNLFIFTRINQCYL